MGATTTTKKKLLRSNSDDRKKDTNALCKRGSPPHPKRSERYLCTYLKGTTTTAKIHVMIFSWRYVWSPWGRVHRVGIREWREESDWLLCTEGWREKYKLNLVWEHREKTKCKLNLVRKTSNDHFVVSKLEMLDINVLTQRAPSQRSLVMIFAW